MRNFTDQEGKKTEEVFPNGVRIVTLVEPSAWYIANVLEPMKQERIQRQQGFNQAEKLSKKMREIAKRELDLEN